MIPTAAKRGVTLVELAIGITIIAILATAASYYIGDQFDAVRYENTRIKMDVIRNAILGNPGVSSEGRRTQFGFNGDMGRLPSALSELTTRGANAAWAYDATLGIGAGWRGPYYNQIFTAEDDVTKDHWGTAFVLNTGAAPPTMKSYAGDTLSGGSVFDKDLIVTFTTDSRQAESVQGYLLNGASGVSGASVVLYFSSAGAITSSTTTSTAAGLYSFTAIPYGFAAIKVTTGTTLGPKTITIDSANTSVPVGITQYASQAP